MRLITRPNLDGVTCAVFITQMEPIEQVVFAHPKDIEDGSVEVKPEDVIANLPYHENVSLWFDHHDKAELALETMVDVKGKRGSAPSTARLVYEYYNSPRLKKFESLLSENDRIDSADLSLDDVTNPKQWVLLSFTLDPYMGLADYHGFANAIIAAIRHGSPIEQILEIPEVKGRVNRYRMDADDFKNELIKISRLDGNVIITDSRDVEMMPTGNRFLAFALFPKGNVQIVLTIHKAKSKTRVRLGKSIFNRTCKLHLGRLAAEYGGGGLDGAAGCLLGNDIANTKIAEIIERLK